MSKLLVVGLGNNFRRDDAVGLIAARQLRTRLGHDVEVLEHHGEPIDLLEPFADVDTAIIIDAVSSGKDVGSLHIIDAKTAALSAELFSVSSHAFSLAKAIEMARNLGKLPSRLIVFGVEGKNFGMGEGLSEEVEAALPQLIQRVAEEVSASRHFDKLKKHTGLCINNEPHPLF